MHVQTDRQLFVFIVYMYVYVHMHVYLYSSYVMYVTTSNTCDNYYYRITGNFDESDESELIAKV